MVICTYFQRGTCKFGNNCRFEHPTGQRNSFGGGGGLLRESRFGGGGGGGNDKYHYNAKFSNQTSGGLFGQSTNNDDAIIQLVRTELLLWDTNKVWPISCFAAQKEQKCISGLVDTSPEELRIEAYKCLTSGSIQPYLEGLSQLTNQILSRRNELKAMNNAQLMEEIEAANTNSQNKSSATSGGLFGSNSSNTNNLFGSSSNKSGIFSSNANTNNPFGGNSSNSNSIFGTVNASSNNNLFGSSNSNSSNLFGSKPTSSTGGLFSNQSNTNLFGSNQSGGGMFSTNSGGGLFSSNQNTGGLLSSNSNTVSGGLFSSNQNSKGLFSTNQNTSGGLFSSNQNMNTGGGLFSTNQNQSNNLFSSNQNTSNTGLFSTLNNNSGVGLFSSPTAVANPFSTQQSTGQASNNLFGNNTTTSDNTNTSGFASMSNQSSLNSSGLPTPFGGQNTPSLNSNQTNAAPANPFLAQVAQSSQVKFEKEQKKYENLQEQKSDTGFKSAVELPDITDQDLASFKADSFEFGKIPTCPPPAELCF